MNLKELDRLIFQRNLRDRKVNKMRERRRLAALRLHAETCPGCAARLRLSSGQFAPEDMVALIEQARNSGHLRVFEMGPDGELAEATPPDATKPVVH